MDLAQLLSLIGSLLTAEFALGVWISNKFEKAEQRQAQSHKELISKLEYHEKHDDQRFSQIHDALWRLRFSIRDRLEEEEEEAKKDKQ